MEENADLFWGLRGGGGNFGIVTSFEYQLHPVGPNVLCGMLFYDDGRIADVLRVIREFGPAAPRELFIAVTLRVAPSAPFMPETRRGTRVVVVACCYSGSIQEGTRVLEPLRRALKPIAETIEPRPYTVWQQALDANWAAGFDNYWKAEYLGALTDDAIEVLAEHFRAMTSPLSDIKIGVLGGGAIADVLPGDSAYTHRGAPFILNINTRWDDGEAERHVAWTRALWEGVRPFSAGGSYVNFLGDEGADRVRESYGGETFERLSALKRKFDPTNFFRINQNIPPS